MENLVYDVVVAGGGIAGICAAIASARGGVKTALVQDRPVLGGNASSEIRMHICGANMHGQRPDARETGILEEIMLENRKRNPFHSFSVLDTILWEKVRFQENLALFLNTRILRTDAENDRICGVEALQLTTEKRFYFTAEIYIDCTGDGVVAAQAGAVWRQGREARSEFGEQHAQEKADCYTMGNTLMFKAVDTGNYVPFQKPEWAYEIDESLLRYRGHCASSSSMEAYDIDSGYWWIELGGMENTITDGETIRDELLKTMYGVWDHIKNHGDHGADNYVLDWVQLLPGKRESRRIEGDYILREQDLQENHVFKDSVAYGGWPMDMHPPQGFHYAGKPTDYLFLKEVYQIPYRCYYSRNIANLMMAGRNISATHMAFGSIRVMGTCAVGGQAGGTAAAMTVKYGCTPRELGRNYITELQQQLLREDCYIPGIRSDDTKDIARTAMITASKELEKGGAQLIKNGVTRHEKNNSNCWISGEMSEYGEWIELSWSEGRQLSEVQMIFDTNLSLEIETSLSKRIRDKQKPGLPDTLVKDYCLEAFAGQKKIFSKAISDNYQRRCIHRLAVKADRLRITVTKTYGDTKARIFEIRVY